MTEDRKKLLRGEFGLLDDADEKDMLWAIMEYLSDLYAAVKEGAMSNARGKL